MGVGGYPLAHQQLEVLSKAQLTAAAIPLGALEARIDAWLEQQIEEIAQR